MEILLYSILPTIIGTLITLFLTEKVKGNIKVSFDKKLETLKKEHTLEIAKFQAEINSIKTQENFKFTKLHEKRFLILEESYKLLNILLSKLNEYISPAKILPPNVKFEDNEDKLQEEFINAHNAFREHFANNKIYFDNDLEKLFDNYFAEVLDIYNDYNANHYLRKLTSNVDQDIYQKAFNAYKKVPEKLDPIKKEIENKFRELLEN